MNTRYLFFSAVCLLAGVGSIHGFTWDADMEVINGDAFGEGIAVDNTIVDMLGGDIVQLHCKNTSTLNLYEGDIDILRLFDSSTLNVYGGRIGSFSIDEQGDFTNVNFYVDNYAYDDLSNILIGKWQSNKGNYSIQMTEETYDKILFVPEPAVGLILLSGCFLIKTRKGKL